MRRSSLVAVLAVLLTVLLATPLSAHLVDVSYSLSAGDLTVFVHTYLPDLCWHLDKTAQDLADQEIRVLIDLYDGTRPDTSCATVIVEKHLEFPFADLGPGLYTLTVTERHFDRHGLRKTEVVTMPIEVVEGVDVRNESFSAIKGVFR